MNMKKAAAETLAAIGDRTVVPKLMHWLEAHDNPGFRQLLVTALKAILGPWFATAVIERLSAADHPRSQQLLIEALGGELSAADVAALVRLRGGRREPWTDALLRSVYADECALSAGTVIDVDAELEHRGLGERIPKEVVSAEGETAGRTSAIRAGVRLRQVLRESPLDGARAEELLKLLCKANVRGKMIVPAFSSSDVDALLDTHAGMGEEARSGVRQILAVLALNPVARLRTARLLRDPLPDEVPFTLMRCVATTMSGSLARQLTDWPDREVQVAAERALLLGDRIDVALWPEKDVSALLARLARERSFDSGFDWSRQKGHLAEWVRAMHRTHGSALALAEIQRWLDSHSEPLRLILRDPEAWSGCR
jgi:hypothetical protein